jgi:hypothetical protein
MSGLSITPAFCIASRKSDESANSSAFWMSTASKQKDYLVWGLGIAQQMLFFESSFLTGA